MFNTTKHKAQEILYAWLSNFEKRSYETIRLGCESISESLGLNLEGRAHWHIFYPLFLSGTLDYAGKDNYALSSSTVVHTGDFTAFINPIQIPEHSIPTRIPGLYLAERDPSIDAIQFNAISVLQTIPDLESIVNNFPRVVVDLSDAEYYMHRHRKGLTKRYRDGIIRYFHIPETVFIREVPSKRQNPDAFNIAYSYSRAICSLDNGKYLKNKSILRVSQFGFPIILFRVLLLETLASGTFPAEDNGEYIFPNISNKTVTELNRILCNTIRYE